MSSALTGLANLSDLVALILQFSYYLVLVVLANALTLFERFTQKSQCCMCIEAARLLLEKRPRSNRPRPRREVEKKNFFRSGIESAKSSRRRERLAIFNRVDRSSTSFWLTLVCFKFEANGGGCFAGQYPILSRFFLLAYFLGEPAEPRVCCGTLFPDIQNPMLIGCVPGLRNGEVHWTRPTMSTSGRLSRNSFTASTEAASSDANFADLGNTLAPLAAAHVAMPGWSVDTQRLVKPPNEVMAPRDQARSGRDPRTARFLSGIPCDPPLARTRPAKWGRRGCFCSVMSSLCSSCSCFSRRGC